jgi:hypothetical protein
MMLCKAEQRARLAVQAAGMRMGMASFVACVSQRVGGLIDPIDQASYVRLAFYRFSHKPGNVRENLSNQSSH